MTIFDILSLICGLALFLYGMDVMGDSLKKSAGNRLKMILGKMTSNPFKGFLLGLGVTLIIQSSSATTVMVVGFVNSGTMLLSQATGVILGANVGTAITAWLTALSGMGGSGAEEALGYIQWLKPDSWMPILALIGICLIMFAKRGKKKDLGAILMGFAVLMVGMELMSDSVGGLKDAEWFKNILIMFENPILGVLAGLVLTAIVQSSSASVGILQSLTTTGAITYGAAIPIVMGQNIGTCVTAMLSSLGANKNGKRAALVHLYFNIISVIVVLSGFYLINYFVDFSFVHSTIGMWGVAAVHTVFKLIAVTIMFPFIKYLEKLAVVSVKDKGDEQINLLDERLMATPTVAIGRADEVTRTMAQISCEAMKLSLECLSQYDPKKADLIREYESKADNYEDSLGTYLVKLSDRDMTPEDSREVTKLLHLIGDFERISDHAVNIVESAEEMNDKKISFSQEAQREIGVMIKALSEIIDLADKAYDSGDFAAAALVEPLEQVVDELKDRIKLNHVLRLQKNECSIEHGFVLNDLLTNFERVSDHCSNIAGCLIEMSNHHALDVHKYLDQLKHGSRDFEAKFNEYKEKYAI